MTRNLIIPGTAPSVLHFGDIEIVDAVSLEPTGDHDTRGWTMLRRLRDDWTVVALMAAMKERVCAPLALGANRLADHAAIEQWTVANNRPVPGERILEIRWRSVRMLSRAA